MLTTIEAEIDVNGKVTFLEPLKISRKSRAIITLLDGETTKGSKPPRTTKNADAEKDAEARQLEWLKANRDQYAGQYVALEADLLIAHADTITEVRQKLKGKENSKIQRAKSY